MSQYKLFLSYNNNQQVIQLPVLPAQFTAKIAGGSTKQKIIDIGEITILGHPDAAVFDIVSFFPANSTSLASQPASRSPREYVEIIDYWMRLAKPVRLVFVGGAADINTAVSIDRFSFSERGGTVGDIDFELSLKEYRFHRVLRAGQDSLLSEAGILYPRQNLRDTPAVYVVQEGDTPVSIAKLMLGDDSKYIDILRLNGFSETQAALGIPVGTVLRLC